MRTPGGSAPLLISSRKRFASADFTSEPDAGSIFFDLGMGAYLDVCERLPPAISSGQFRVSAQIT
jgi:hypothetical protein